VTKNTKINNCGKFKKVRNATEQQKTKKPPSKWIQKHLRPNSIPKRPNLQNKMEATTELFHSPDFILHMPSCQLEIVQPFWFAQLVGLKACKIPYMYGRVPNIR